VYDLLDPSILGSSTAAAGSQQQSSAQVAGVGGYAAGQGAGGGRILKHALLQPQESGRRALRIREDGQGRVIIPGLTEVCRLCLLAPCINIAAGVTAVA
jgi:hypothetical protein